MEKNNFFKHESLGSQAISKNVKYQFCYPDKYSKQFLPLLQIPRFFILSIFLHVHIRDAGLVGEFSDKFSGRNFSHKVCRKILRQVSWEKKWRILVSIYKNKNSLFLHPLPKKNQKCLTMTLTKPNHDSNCLPSGSCLAMSLTACPVGSSPDLT